MEELDSYYNDQQVTKNSFSPLEKALFLPYLLWNESRVLCFNKSHIIAPKYIIISKDSKRKRYLK